MVTKIDAVHNNYMACMYNLYSTGLLHVMSRKIQIDMIDVLTTELMKAQNTIAVPTVREI